MGKTRDRSKAIYHDYLGLIDVEIGVYGRNREHLIHLPEQARTDVRAFMTDCAVKKTDIAAKLDAFYRLNELANQTQIEGIVTGLNDGVFVNNLTGGVPNGKCRGGSIQ